jgi:hypothetical protein
VMHNVFNVVSCIFTVILFKDKMMGVFIVDARLMHKHVNPLMLHSLTWKVNK